MRQFTDDHNATVYNLQSTDDNKESTIYSLQMQKMLKRCSKMLKDDRKPATDQQMDQWINGSTDLWINGSTMKVNAPKTEMKKRKLLRILRKVPAWRML